MPRESLSDRLKRIRRWNFVPGRGRILPVIENLIKEDEIIIDLIDGFFPEGSVKNSSGENGFILVTDRSVLVVNTGSPGKTSAIRREKIRDVTIKKNHSSLLVRIDTPDGIHEFITLLSEAAVKDIFSAAGKRPADDSNSGDSPPEYGWSSVESPAVDISYNAGQSDLLFKEVKKINSKMRKFREEITDTGFFDNYKQDIYTLASICGMSARELTDNEMLFICMSLYAGEERGKTPGLIEHIEKNDSFPVRLGEFIDCRMGEITEELGKRSNGVPGSLGSLEYLSAYDTARETKYADQLASLYYEFSQCLLKADGNLTGDEEEKLSAVTDIIGRSRENKTAEADKTADENLSIDQVMEKIDALVGMEDIKEDIRSFINYVNIRKEREKRNLPVTPISLHAVFYGPPGTGKTTIARLLGKVYKSLGLLKSGHLVETDRAGLVAGYVGQTAIKTDELVTKAKDGVLFIDEAYTLIPENGMNDFGRESVDTILKRMEDMRDGFAVIAAGYTDEMERFINSNPGLKSRFSRYFYFNHYTPDELMKIFFIFAGNVEFKLTEGAERKMRELVTHFYELRSKSFGNARFVRNVFDRIVQNQADRLATVKDLTDEILCGVTEEDIPTQEDFSSEQFSGSR